MAQLTIYLDPETQRKVEAAAKRESISLSRWARERLSKAADIESSAAWDHLSLFSGTIGDDFQLPSRDPQHRVVSSMDS